MGEATAQIRINYPSSDFRTERFTCTLCTFYLSINVFSTKVLIGDTILTSPNGDGTATLRGHPSHAKV